MDRAHRSRRSSLESWRIVGLAAAAVALVVASVFAIHGTGEAGLRSGIRATATSSLLFFAGAFAASPANTLFASPLTKWLLRNRRYVGLSFAVSHVTHLGLIVALAFRHAASFRAHLSVTTLVGGGIGYVLLALMTITSFDAPAARLGRARWRALHTVGMYTFWVIFTFSYAGGALAGSARYGALLAIPVAALALRVAAARRRAHLRASGARAASPAS